MIIRNHYTINTSQYEGIIKLSFQDHYDFTLADAKEVLEDLKIICGSKRYPMLKIPGKFSAIDGDVRAFISSEEGLQCSSAEAIVTTYLPQRIIGNFYLRVNKPVKPTLLFNTEEGAVAWLQQFR